MIAVLIDNAATLRLVASLCIAALMIAAFLALAAAVLRTTTRRHARFWSPPRRARLFAAGRHSEAYRYRVYAATRAKHTTRPPRQIPAAVESAAPVVASHPDTVPWSAVPWELTTQPIRLPVRQFARTA